MKILLVGGSKSGKSRLAQRLAKALSAGGPMYYWATMEPVDNEDRERIEKHLADRAGWGFETVECGRGLESAPLPEGCENASVLFDSVTALVTNEMFGGFTEEAFDANVAAKRAEEARESSFRGLMRLADSFENTILVADDVFRDGREFDETTELWRKALAGALRRIAAEFDTVCEVTAGIPKPVKGSLPDGFEVKL
ncbi:MAG: bifunctional adenosylcobinamide kinase/adenosylcobinamide-phosphate guanylyltransferase [Clostridia bacterium]|nr:bifunctional adenosylcobinamide kinase/adenosylcobinamide-phosphate guanylyltransferase [Clostridia bacterium]